MSFTRLGVCAGLATATILSIVSACSSSSKSSGKTPDAGRETGTVPSDGAKGGETSALPDGSGSGSASDSQAATDGPATGSGSGSCAITPGTYLIDYSAPAAPDAGDASIDAAGQPADCVPPNGVTPFTYPPAAVDASIPDATVTPTPDAGVTCTTSVSGGGSSPCVSTRTCSIPLNPFVEKTTNVETVTGGVPAGVSTQIVLAPDGGVFSSCTYDYQWVAVAVDAGIDSAAEQ